MPDRDPVTGRELPEGFALIRRVPGFPFGAPVAIGEPFRYDEIVIAQDHYGRNLSDDLSAPIVRAWRDWRTAPRSAKLAYAAWKVARMQGAGRISIP